MVAKVIAFRLTERDALKLLAKIANNSSRVVFTDHARAQMRKRRISPLQVINCLKKGVVTESPCLDFKGFWKLTIERYAAGEAIGCGISIDIREPLETFCVVRVQGARSAGTAVYMWVHEDSEHRATRQSDRAGGFERFPRVLPRRS